MDDRRTAIGPRLPIVVSGRGLSGTQAGEYGVSTVSKVSVKTGNSITIPCRYNLRYIEYVKYWCQGDYWNSCSALVRTDQPKISGTVSISDDVTRRIFSVTMTDLQPEDSGYYWCAVETTGRDQHTYLHLSVTTGTPGLYVDQQEVTGVEGGSVTVCCHYSNTVAKKWLWCKMGIYYVPLVGRYSGLLDGTSVTSQQTIDNNNRHILTVTLNGLNMGDTGWYWCSTGDLQMPVHITVNQLTTTQSITPASTTTPTPTSTITISTVDQLTTTQTDTIIKKLTPQDISLTSPTTVVPAVSSSTSQAPVNNTHDGAQGWERTLFYLPKTVNAVLFLLCTIIAVVKFMANRL
ncbi:polymeric immunoglobulin receptor-like [Coregonus clupeaformis]|uniref:polymeric immunoglobulin receptor-like n=1 Tax=Coregonus clupeaformis TaxID=59861 RepID=UPI001E1C6B8E|nr:polymeric immunoglobulin receptor-like [Coregonus clupeaformis]XP_045073033.1 polymeric immunoglobulin receptor-like [Coregonus clupeaformis]